MMCGHANLLHALWCACVLSQIGTRCVQDSLQDRKLSSDIAPCPSHLVLLHHLPEQLQPHSKGHTLRRSLQQ